MVFFDRLRRVLLVLDLDSDIEATVCAAEWLSPAAERVHCLCLPDVRDELDQMEGQSSLGLAELDKALGAWQQRSPGLLVSRALEAGLNAGHIAKVAEELAVTLVVMAPLRAHSGRDRASLLLRLLVRHHCHVLSLGSGIRVGSMPKPPLRHVALSVDADAASVPVLASFVSGLGRDVSLTALVASVSETRRQELAAMFEAHNPDHTVSVRTVSVSATNLAEVIDHAAHDMAADLVVGAADAVSNFEVLALGFFAGSALQQAVCPVLLLPRRQDAPIYLKERLVASDALLVPEKDPRVAVERSGAFGRVALSAHDSLVAIERGVEYAPLPHDDGVVALPRTWFAADESVFSLVFETRSVLRESAAARVLRPTKPLVLLEASIAGLPLESLTKAAETNQLIFVRMRRSDEIDEVRERLSAYSAVLGSPFVVDASAWLDDGGAEDVPSVVDGQRLLRVGLRMIVSGLAVRAVITKDQRLRTHACQVLTAQDFRDLDLERELTCPAAPQRPASTDEALEHELDLCTHSRRVPGHEVQLEFDNTAARRIVLRLIAEAKERICWQCYIVEDDATTAEFAKALADAAARGVEVRFLADALYSLHEAFGRRNSLLSQLAASPGVSVRAFRPVTGVPNLSALKRRNHRKCIVVDGRKAVITGRNLGATYYRGFQEVRLDALSPYREVPWLDCGASFTGALVTELERSFDEEWQRAGGTLETRSESSATGSMDARLVIHAGLRDTHTFDAQLALIRHAQRELVVVNNFPLVVELQRALVNAVSRGVRVRILFGSVRPHFGNEQPFVGGNIRSIADQLVRSSLDAVIAAGGEAYEYALPARPDWDPKLGRVFTHVHAKLLTRDGKDVAIGSANLDVTAAYWESEALLIVHDTAFAAVVDQQLQALFATSRAVDPHTESFRAESSQRAWLARYWPSLIG